MPDFTQREIEILKYVAKGYSNREIADFANRSPHTIKFYISSMLKKSGLKSRAALSAYAAENHILTKSNKKLILIDLDGVLNQYDGNFDPNKIPPIKDGAEEFLEKLYSKYALKLFTTRNEYLAKQWLENNDLSKYFLGVTNIKEPCYLIVDDRCAAFNGDYGELLNKIDTYKVWWK